MNDSEIFIIGAKGQLGLALQAQYPGAKNADIDELDITRKESVESFDWTGIKIILNAAAYTNVDGAETAEGRVVAWKVNAAAMSYLVSVAQKNDMTLVHISTDYVFDGTMAPHTENEPMSPLSVYGASKAAGDLIISTHPKHYILRTSWVIGSGKNFVRTMIDLGKKGINPSVVNDQIGRLTFTSQLVNAVQHLLENKAPYGTYNISNDGDSTSWAVITEKIFKLAGLTNTVTSVTTEQYYRGKDGIALRPLGSTLDIAKIKNSGYLPANWQDDLAEYVTNELAG